MARPNKWPGPTVDTELDPGEDLSCSRPDCGVMCYEVEGSERPVVIECGKALKRGQGRRCVYRCPNGVEKGDSLASVVARWQAGKVEPNVP